MAETAELDTTQEEASKNGHEKAWESFDDAGLLQHITSKQPLEEVVEVPEWGVKILCKSLNAEHRIEVETLAWDTKTQRMYYGKASHLMALYGCYNPTTGNRVFSDAHKETLQRPEHGSAVVRLSLVILRLSGMVATDVEKAKKN